MFLMFALIVLGGSVGGVIGYALMSPSDKEKINNLTADWLKSKLPNVNINSKEDVKKAVKNLSEQDKQLLAKYLKEELKAMKKEKDNI